MPERNLTNLPGFTPVDGREETFLRYAEGIGRVRPDGKGLSVAMNVYDTQGNSDGTQICSGEVQAASLDDLVRLPPHEPVEFGERGPLREVPVTAICKATWTFKDGSTISALGKGTSHIIPLKPGPTSLPAGLAAGKAGVMADVAVMVITGGTGEFDGARGIVTLNSTVFLPDVQKAPFGIPGAQVHQKSIHTFRVYRGSDID